ncbi:Uncharacterized protein FKW44_019406, partial [Caligus rogercresseyi]
GAGYYSGHVEEGSLSLFLRGTRELASTPGSYPSHASLSPPSGCPLPPRATRRRTTSASGRKWKSTTPHGTRRPLAGSPNASRSSGATWPSSAAPPPPGSSRASTKWSTRTTFVHDPTCHTSRTRTFIPIWIPLPSKMEDIYAEDEDSHTVLVKSINACSVKYVPAKRSLLVVSTDEDTQRKAAMIQGMYFQNFTQKVLLKSKTEEVERHLEATRIQSTYGYTEESHVPSELMGLATGANGANIQQARSVGCIIYLELQEETSTFRVTGDNKDCVRKARKLLEGYLLHGQNQLADMFKKFYPKSPISMADKPANKVSTLNIPISAATLQGYFMLFKHSAEKAILNVKSLRPRAEEQLEC